MIRQLKLPFIVGLLAVSPSVAQENTTFETTSVSKKHRLTFFMVGDVPDNKDATHSIRVLINDAYAVGYSEERQNPIWSAYHVDRTSNAPKHDRPMKFHLDLRTAAKVTAGDPYKRSKFEMAYSDHHPVEFRMKTPSADDD